jgi:hypothetical protein
MPLMDSLLLQPQIDPHPESFPHDAGRASAFDPLPSACVGEGVGGWGQPNARCGCSITALVEIDRNHCSTCFADGVQVATGCTFGKGNIRSLG